MAREIAERAARLLAGKVDEYLVSAGLVSSVMVKYANGEVSVTQAWKDYSLTVYATKGGRMNVATYTAQEPSPLLAQLPAMIEKLTPSPLYAPLPEPTGVSLSFVDRKIKEAAAEGDASALTIDLQEKDVAGMISAQHSHSHYLGSNGLDLGYEITSYNGYLRVFKGDDSGQWAWVSTSLEPRMAVEALVRASDLAEMCHSLPKETAAGEHRVLLSPMIAGNLLEHVAEAANAGSVIMGFSFFQGKEPGAVVASEELSIKEVPRDSRLPGYRGFDDEGVATSDKYLIEKGSFRGLLHNSKTARLTGQKSTGNAGLILPRLFNIEIEGGDLRESELLEALGDGLYATNNWYTRFQNHVEGLFSTVTRDAFFIVKRGRPVACARRVRITGSMPELLMHIEGLSRERWQLKWWEIDTPSIVPFVLLKRAQVTSVTS
ncbi:MAG: TldD/PmbA family protein [Acidilobaceae archaeon]|nr:TldD/PmbA family protein [Acidilobaceae archaeon]MCX8165825.1 TldD/PmbA family protein [Acidilobaceae archaeon]MDW7974249.1 TldD/PmbA family protein [Sulfolobales archaeon]